MEKTRIFVLMAILLSKCVVNALRCEMFSREKCDEQENCTTYSDCPLRKEPAYCYAVWHNDTQLNKVDILVKGCSYGSECVENNECVDRKPLVDSPILGCCCSGDNCNSKLIWEPATINTDISYTMYKTAVYIIFVLCICYAAYKVYLYQFSNNKPWDRPSIDQTIELNEIPSANSTNLDNRLPMDPPLVEETSMGPDRNFLNMWSRPLTDPPIDLNEMLLSSRPNWENRLPVPRHPLLVKVNAMGPDRSYMDMWRRPYIDPPIDLNEIPSENVPMDPLLVEALDRNHFNMWGVPRPPVHQSDSD